MFIKFISAFAAWVFTAIMFVRYVTGSMQPEVYNDPVVGWTTFGFTVLVALLGATILFWPLTRRG